MQCGCASDALSRVFTRYSRVVCRHPLPFIVIPPIVALVLTTGLIFLNETQDIEYLYVPHDAPGFDERQLVLDRFSWDDVDNFTAFRTTHDLGYLQVIVRSKTGDDAWTDDVVQEASRLHYLILDTEVRYDGERLNFSDVCSAWNDTCSVSTLVPFLSMCNVTDINVTFPVHNTQFGALHLTSQVGGVDVDPLMGIIRSARSLMLQYHTRFRNKQANQRSTAWLEEALKRVNRFKSHDVKVYARTHLSLEQEFNDSIMEVILLFFITFTIIAVFAVSSMFMNDMVRSKPWVAVAGLLSAAMASGCALGSLTWIGVPFTSPVGIAPFLIIGIGLDDVYILVSSWRFTSVVLSTEERVARTLKNSAVSITITSVTDALAFGVGMSSSFRSVQIFCAYVMAGVIFCYCYQLTFTLAVLTYSGRREADNRHCITFKHVYSKVQTAGRSFLYRLMCTGGDPPLSCASSRVTSPDDVIGNMNDMHETKAYQLSCAVAKSASKPHAAPRENGYRAFEHCGITRAGAHVQFADAASHGAFVVGNTASSGIVNKAYLNIPEDMAMTHVWNENVRKNCTFSQDLSTAYAMSPDMASMHYTHDIQGFDITFNEEPTLSTQATSYHEARRGSKFQVVLPTQSKKAASRSHIYLPTVDATGDNKNASSKRSNGAVRNGSTKATASWDGKRSSRTRSKQDDVTKQPNTADDILRLPWLTQFLGEKFAPWLMKPLVRVCVGLLYIAYLWLAIMGILKLNHGLKLTNLVPDASYVSEFIDIYTDDFLSDYGSVVHIVYDDPTVNYSSLSFAEDYMFIVESFKRTSYFRGEPDSVVSWFDRFREFLALTSRNELDMSEEQFVDVLKNEFMVLPYNGAYQTDITFDPATNFTTIKASRVFVQCKDTNTAVRQEKMVELSRSIVQTSRYDVISFAIGFPFYDMFAVILPLTIQSLSIAVGAMFIVSLVFIPSITTVIMVTLVTVSIEVGVIGFMAWWDVYMDTIAMINLIMCIGFSVDFAAHISYHYVISKHADPIENAKEALGQLGTPILMAALSTVLSVVALSTSDSYIFRTFFKIITLIMGFGFFHAMCLIPVFLSTVKGWQRRKPKVFEEKTTQTVDISDTASLIPIVKRGRLDYVVSN